MNFWLGIGRTQLGTSSSVVSHAVRWWLQSSEGWLEWTPKTLTCVADSGLGHWLEALLGCQLKHGFGLPSMVVSEQSDFLLCLSAPNVSIKRKRSMQHFLWCSLWSHISSLSLLSTQGSYGLHISVELQWATFFSKFRLGALKNTNYSIELLLLFNPHKMESSPYMRNRFIVVDYLFW